MQSVTVMYRGPVILQQSDLVRFHRRHLLTVVPSYAIQFGTMIEAIVKPEAVRRSVCVAGSNLDVVPARNKNRAPENTMLLVSMPV